MKINAETAARVRGKRVCAHRLAGLGPAQAHGMPAGARMAEVVIERDHAVHFGAGQIEPLGHRGNGRRGDKSQRRLDGVQHFEQGTGACLVFSDDAPHDGLFGRR